MKDSVNIGELEKLAPDFMGLIFYPKSKRYAGDAELSVIKSLNSGIEKVGVFVNEDIEKVLEITSRFGINTVQLHGSESVEDCKRLKEKGYTVIKVFSVEDKLPDNLNDYKSCADFFLFDTKTPEHGGSGKKFNWQILKDYDNDKPLFLSGGIEPESIEEIKNLKSVNIYALDINSRFEIEPGLKNIELIKEFKTRLLA